MTKNAKHVTLGSEQIYETIKTACNLLDIPIYGTVKAILNPSKRPFCILQWTLIVHNENFDTLKELLLLTAPTIEYSSKDGYYAERMQRKGLRRI